MESTRLQPTERERERASEWQTDKQTKRVSDWVSEWLSEWESEREREEDKKARHGEENRESQKMNRRALYFNKIELCFVFLDT